MPTRDDVARELYELGRHAHREGRLIEAAELLRASAHVDPHFKTLELLGEILIDLRQTRDAAIYLAAAVGLGPKQSKPRYFLAQVLASWGQTDDARILLREALRLNPQYKSAIDLLNQLPTAPDDE